MSTILRSSHDWDDWYERMQTLAHRYGVVDLVRYQQLPERPVHPNHRTFRHSKGIENWNDQDCRIFQLLKREFDRAYRHYLFQSEGYPR